MDSLDSPIFKRSALEEMLSAESRQLLIKKLAEKDPRLADIYKGIFYPISSMDSANYSEKYPQAAHSLRMLMEKMIQYLEMPIQENEPSLGEKVNELERKWKKFKERNLGFEEVNSQLINGIMGDIDSFFQWKKSNRPQRREAFLGLTGKMDPSFTKLPNNVATLKFKRWKDLHNFFNLVAKHHTIVNSRKEFVGKLEELESLLLEMMVPKPTEAQPDIDQIISEGES